MATNRELMSERGPSVDVQGHFGSLEVVRVDMDRSIAVFRVQSSQGLIGPEESAPLSTIYPSSSFDSLRLWSMIVKELWHKIQEEKKIPSSVKDYKVTMDEDSTGDPAFYVTILVTPSSKNIKDKEVTEWNQFRSLLETNLLRLRLQRQPYVQLGEWRRKR